MFELTVGGHFDAAHYLREYKGKCARIHGHTWRVVVKIRGTKIDKTGMLVDFSLVKSKLQEVINLLDHILLNEIPDFSQVNPTAENISQYIYHRLEVSLCDYAVTIFSVTVWESPDTAATYFKSDEQDEQ